MKLQRPEHLLKVLRALEYFLDFLMGSRDVPHPTISFFLRSAAFRIN